MTDMRASYARFLEFLEERQRCAETTWDAWGLRESLAKQRVGVGFVTPTLETKYQANLRKLFPTALPMDSPGWYQSDVFVCLGMLFRSKELSHPGMEKTFAEAPADKAIVLLEQGFIASVASWSESFRTGQPELACLSWVLDDVSQYYMAEYPSRLVQKLNQDEEPTETQLHRARRLMDRIRAHRISKYNSQPVVPLPKSDKRRVLVCDQTYADASTVYGLADDRAFEDMLLAAIRENPDAEVLVKTHPDTVHQAGGRRARPGFFSGMQDYRNVRFLTQPMNPIALLEEVDTVYVATSGMGMEALMLGRHVVCFGAPFYAGWNLTDDRNPVPHRYRDRSLEALFYYTYIWYSHYATPASEGPCDLEQVLDYIVQHRPQSSVECVQAQYERTEPPKVSVIIPMYNVEEYIESCVRSVLNQTLQHIEILIVNDMSEDGSQAVVDALAAQDDRIRSIRLSRNVGQGFARNEALKHAKGEFVWFLDSDDLLTWPTVLAKSVAIAEQEGADLVRTRKETRDERSDKPVRRMDPAERHFPDDLPTSDLLHSPGLLQNNHFWNFLYRRRLITDHDIRFDLTQWEERPFLLHALLSATRISFANFKGTTYRIRSESTARREKTESDIEKRQQNFRLCIRLFREREAHQPDSALYYHYRFCVTRSLALVFSGFQRDYILERPTLRERTRVYEKIADLLTQTGLPPEELVREPAQIDPAKWESGYYHLLYAAARANAYDLIDYTLREARIPQPRAYSYLLAEQQTELGRALNVYIRHRHVAPISNQMAPHSTPPKPRLVLHIGSTKTGSTFLQHFCDVNRAALLRQGIWYPEFGQYSQPKRAHKTAGHAQFMREATEWSRAPLRTLLLSGLRACPVPIHTVVLSSEAFFLRNSPQQLVDHLSDIFEVEVLVYLRRQDDWANSQYVEFVGGGALNRISQTPEEWLNDPLTRQRLDYDTLLRGWEAAVGEHSLTVRPYEPEQLVGKDLLTDFRRHVRIPAGPNYVMPSRDYANEMPLTEGHIQLLRHFNSLPFESKSHYLDFVEAVSRRAQEVGARSGRRVEVLGSELRQKVLAWSMTGNANVARRYLGREDGSLFLDTTVRDTTKQDQQSLHEFGASEVDLMFDMYHRLGAPAKRQQSPSRRPGRQTSTLATDTKNSSSQDSRSTSTTQTQAGDALVTASFEPRARRSWRGPIVALWESQAPVVRALGRNSALRKLRKLQRDPAAFLADSKYPPARVLSTLMPRR